MKFLFVSPEKATLHRYRREIVFRIAGGMLIGGILLQAAVIAVGFVTWRKLNDQGLRRTAIAAQTEELRRVDQPLKEVRQQLAQIRQWEPVLRCRLPVSAVFGALEAAIPDSAVIDSLALEADQYDRVQINGGTYRTPTNYRVVIQGKVRPGATAAVQEFADALQKRLPAEAELVRVEHQEGQSGDLLSFVIQYSIKPTGKYFGSGLTRITDPSSL
jgi:hypothetical protein